MITGECFCSRVKYQVEGTLCNARSCHCSRCRKAFSGASSAYAELSPDASFRWISRETLSTHDTGEEWAIGFCNNCGSTLCGLWNGEVHGLTLGCVNGDPGVEIDFHLFVGSKAPWDHIGGTAPQFPEHPAAADGA